MKPRQTHPADQQRRLVIDTTTAAWVPGLVRWAPTTVVQPHGHPGGEQIFELDGVFQDEHGSSPVGGWPRNPPGCVHRPWRRRAAPSE